MCNEDTFININPCSHWQSFEEDLPEHRGSYHENIFFFDNTEILCPMPATPPHALVTGTEHGVGDELVYSCQAGYKLEGSSKLMCQLNTTWDNPTPICTSMTII